MPRHVAGDRVDHYAIEELLGYELLAGAPPSGGATEHETMTLQLTASPAALPPRRPDVPPAMEAVIARALRRSPEHRYQSAAEMLRDLRDLDAVDMSRLSAGVSADPPMRGMAAGAIITASILLR